MRLLGRVEADQNGRPLSLGRRRERLLLGILLLAPGAVVPVDRLTELLWDDNPPGNARAQLNTHVSRLRGVLDPDHDGSLGLRLTSKQGGIVAETDPDLVDAHRFRRLVEAALVRPAPSARADGLGEALALWRGPLLADVADDRLRQRVGASLIELRMIALEKWAEAELAAGRAETLVGELSRLTGEHPLHEPFALLLMQTLSRLGRPGDALQAFETIRRHLAEELGADPGAELRSLHVSVLRGEASPAPGRDDLPPDIADFTARSAEIERLATVDSAPAVRLVAIEGMAGVGKTALAVHVAHRLAEHYPDARLFLNLHGHTEGAEPAGPAAALESLLRAWGVPAETIPAGLDERASRWRAELAGRRVLVVLDDAASAAQIRPLLPGTAGSLVLITCRNSLTDLEAVDPLTLDVLPGPEAVRLLGRVAGRNRTESDPAAAAEVARLCGHLPLAVRIAAARLRSRPAWTVTDLARRLGDEQHRLAELSVGDRSVTGAFMLSYHHLSDAQRRVFRLLGLHPGTDLALAAAAALTGEPVLATERDLDALVDAHMVQQQAGGRYRLHDLLRELARDLVRRDPVPGEPVNRLLDHYESWLADAAAAIDPRGRRSGYDEAIAWCETEHDNLVAVAAYASRHGWTGHAWRIPDRLWLYLRTRGRHLESIELHRLALAAVGDLDEARSALLRNQANSYVSLGRYDDARDALRDLLEVCRRTGDRGGEGSALATLGVVAERTGDYETALEHYHRALPLRRSVGDRWGEAANLLYLGLVLDRLGRHAEALDRYEESLALRREMNDVRGEGATLTCAGMTYDRLGRYDEALSHHGRALDLMRRAKDRQGEAAALGNLANVLRHLGRPAEALDHHRKCLEILREVGDRNSESDVLNDVGETYLASGRVAEAVSSHRSALALAEEVQARREQARAHDGIARCVRDDDPDVAERHWRQALDLYRRIGGPEADRITSELATMDRR